MRNPEHDLGLDALTVTLAVILWFATGSFVLAVGGGLGEHPWRRGLIGAGLVLAYVAALAARRPVCAALRRHPWLPVAVASVQLAAAIADGALDSAYTALALTSIGLAAVAARARTVWLCVALLVFGYGAATLSERSPATLQHDGDLGVALGLVVSAPVSATLILALRWLLLRFVNGADGMVGAWRAGAPTLTPGLSLAISAPPARLELRRGAEPRAGLTATEIEIVEALARGRSAKQIAHDREIALSTVRTHIRNAKRKTGARTLRELAGLTAHPDWPDVGVLRA
jgi:DNA-binding CsgD family transcriptional regulator